MTRTLSILLLGLTLAACADDPSAKVCPAALDCDDGLSCTLDTCDDQGQKCAWALLPDSCLIEGACYQEGASDPTNPCVACQPSLNARGWSLLPDGTSCDQGNECFAGSRCDGGNCDAPAVPCDDAKQCTVDQCDVDEGCSNEPSPWGTPCDDGDPCTGEEQCVEGECGGGEVGCDDTNPCTDDSCDEVLGCLNEDNANPCEDGDPCTGVDLCGEGSCHSGDKLDCDDGNDCTIDLCDALAGCLNLPDAALTCDDGDPCTSEAVCTAGQCEGSAPTDCDDGNTCTIDSCDPESGCTHAAVSEDPCCEEGLSICDDGDACTTDDCDPESLVCSHGESTAECDDGDACTGDDTCAAGICAGQPMDCNDGNGCTADACDPEVGCSYEPLSDLPCDDGLACSTGDSCANGECVAEFEDCLCIPDFYPDSVKANSLKIAESEAEGFDLDGDGDIDNTLSALAPMVNGNIADSVEAGGLVLLLEFRGPIVGDTQLAVYQGSLDESQGPCDFQNETCPYLVDPAFLDADGEICKPVVSMAVTILGTKMQGGGVGTNFPFQIPLGDAFLAIELKNVFVSGDLVIKDGEIVAMTGTIGGAIPEKQLVEALESLPEDALGDAFTPEQVIGLLGLLVDIDLDGDGEADAISVALLLEAIDGIIVGYE